MPFNVQAARQAGYSDQEIADYLRAHQDPTLLGQQEGSPQGIMGGPLLAYIATAGQRLGRVGARLADVASYGALAPQDVNTNPGTEQSYPVASGLGAATPYLLAPNPGGFLANVGLGGAQGLLLEQDPAKGAALGALGAGIGYGIGSMAGRVVNAVQGAYKSALRRLPSGIEQTTGELMGSGTIQKAEQALARNPVTAGPFVARSERNRQLLANRVLDVFGQDGNQLTESAIGQAYADSVDKIRTAVPDEAAIPIGQETQDLFKRFNSLTDEIVSLPEGDVLTGKAFRNVRSDLLALTQSSKATIREAAHKALEAVDEAAQASGMVDTGLYKEGRRMYRLWKTLTSSGVTKPGQVAGTLDINPASLDRSLGKSFGQKSTQGGISTGDPAVDALIQTVRDLRRTADFQAGSVTTTGMGIPAVIADVATTGGVGTLSSYAASRLSQSGPAAGFLEGLVRPNPGVAGAGAEAGKAAASTLNKRKKD